MSKFGAFRRRDILRASAAGAALAPFIPLLDGDAEANEGTPTRVIFCFSNLGWIPRRDLDGSFANTMAHPVMADLAPFQDEILFMRGLDYKAASDNPNDHPPMIAALMTSRRTVNPTNAAPTSGPGWDPEEPGPSIDQAIGAYFEEQTPFPTMEMMVGEGNYSYKTLFDHEGSGIRPESDPGVAQATYLPDDGGDTLAAESRRQRRLSVLDFVKDDLTSVQQSLGQRDREKLERHLEHVRAREVVEQTPIPFCGAPEVPGDALRAEGGNEGFLSSMGRRHLDTVVRAMTCDLTRVATVQWHMREWAADWMPSGENPHAMSHENSRWDEWAEAYRKHGSFYMLHLAHLLSELQAVPEGDGTMLDNTVVCWLCEHALSGGHRRDDIPVVRAGRAGGAVLPGRQMDFDERSMSDLYVALAQAVGTNMTTFGDPQFFGSPIDLA